MRITIAQLNPLVGDINGNLSRALETMAQAARERADLVVFTELFLIGYPPRDLLGRCWVISRIEAALQELARASRDTPGLGVIVGAPLPTGRDTGHGLYNSAVLIQDGEIRGTVNKSLLPTYDVFDEDRYFDRHNGASPLPFKGEKLGLHICEDAWNDPELWPRRRMYDHDPVAELAAQGATILINISASPYGKGKEQVRYRLISRHAQRHGLPFVYANQVGGNDELIFDGRSFVFDAQGQPLAVLPSFAESLTTVDLQTAQPVPYEPQPEIASVHDALVLGIRDYLRKCGFSQAIVGLSGGIDSAVTACLAAAALGPENVRCLAMPSQYSSTGSIEDAQALARNLGIELGLVPIKPIYEAYLATLQELFAGTPPGLAEENVQARIRGNLLMAMSNKYGSLVITTGNKSELAVGYCTLYGDMSGGLAAISDVPKMMVYEVARYLNHQAAVGGVEARPARPGHAAAVRDSRPDHPVVCRRGLLRRRHRRAGLR
jgi:NAD+ synthase (glutamine-hydrolysing)